MDQFLKKGLNKGLISFSQINIKDFERRSQIVQIISYTVFGNARTAEIALPYCFSDACPRLVISCCVFTEYHGIWKNNNNKKTVYRQENHFC